MNLLPLKGGNYLIELKKKLNHVLFTIDTLKIQKENSEFPCGRLRIWHHCSGLGHCYGSGLIPGPGTFTGAAKNK